MPPRATKPAKPSLRDVIASIRDKDGVKIGQLPDFMGDTTAISTGNLAIDYVTGIGGLPIGRVTELYGLPASGKTSIALQTACTVQRTGGTILYLDYEKSLSPDYCAALGLDTTDDLSFFYMQPQSFEQGMNAFRKIMSTGELTMLIVDSVAAMVSEKEMEADTGKATVADRAKLMAQVMRQITGPIHDNHVCAVFLNHLMEEIDATPMGQKLRSAGIVRKTTPGGKALKYYASLRLEFSQVGSTREEIIDPITNSESKMTTATRVKVLAAKNKVGLPNRSVEVTVRYGRGFSAAQTVYDVLVGHGVVKKKVAGVHDAPEDLLPEGVAKLPQGTENVVRLLENDLVLLDRWRDRAQEVLDALVVRSVPSDDEDAVESVDA